ncbi:hypothetical protein AAFF_G00229720 [Aldrovandia affinis]|uniref:Uncharacterized protein n=1 Tax=Aldrovandia affinis TaxID=143900 RepID=A0AAD7WU45_9TELE|nr:hypothetical protein AAFF_G00229720 [Aldrovandia affinis]
MKQKEAAMLAEMQFMLEEERSKLQQLQVEKEVQVAAARLPQMVSLSQLAENRMLSPRNAPTAGGEIGLLIDKTEMRPGLADGKPLACAELANDYPHRPPLCSPAMAMS